MKPRVGVSVLEHARTNRGHLHRPTTMGNPFIEGKDGSRTEVIDNTGSGSSRRVVEGRHHRATGNIWSVGAHRWPVTVMCCWQWRTTARSSNRVDKEGLSERNAQRRPFRH
jgi:hypothetical protein